MLDVDVAAARLGEIIKPLRGTERARVEAALGRVPAQDIVAPMSLPPFDASAMDGYAVSATDMASEGRKRLQVTGQSLAGHPASETAGAGKAIRIFTGAPMPAGADSVVLQEDVTTSDGTIEFDESVSVGQHVRPSGNDIAKGDTICRAGRRLTPYDLAWLAACGIGTVRVRRRVRVVLLSTGDELAEPGMPLGEAQIYDSNRFAMTRLLEGQGSDIIDLGCVPDDPHEIRAALAEAADIGDIVVTSGGVSVGDADHVRDLVAELGSIDFWRIALKPGKPLAVGDIGGTPFFGLPGNPVSTIVTCLLFVAPAIDLLAGATPSPPLTIPATLTEEVPHAPGRREYMRGIASYEKGTLKVAINGNQGSNRLATFSGANCLVIIPANASNLPAGETVEILPLGNDGHPLRH
ncbi:MAG: molybdopterin molybdotransferase MoeA [Gammaproteobacteria bacterium]|nr:molybdopterin molybdotransferase MoeA [Gammaproteobacteria bacterium]